MFCCSFHYNLEGGKREKKKKFDGCIFLFWGGEIMILHYFRMSQDSIEFFGLYSLFVAFLLTYLKRDVSHCNDQC